MSGVAKRTRHDPDRVREMTVHASSQACSRGTGISEDDRHRPQRLREPAGAGGLLADAAARERQRLVGGGAPVGRRRAAGADGAPYVERAVELARDRQPAL